MIIFSKMKFRNILSYGNTWTEIDFSDATSTLLMGKNGTGKSSFLDALTFALYGRAFRKINIAQLVNSVNQKGLEVCLKFSINDNNYKVTRGRWPSIFEIWVNDSLIAQSASIKDYQKILTEQILSMNYNTFSQIVILGSSSFTPFMELTPPTRKSIIENLLDISVFSVMNQVVRERLNKFKEDLQELNHNIEILNNSYIIKKEHAEVTLKNAEEIINSINERLLNYNNIIDQDQGKIDQLTVKLSKLTVPDTATLRQKESQLNEYRIKISSKIKRFKVEKLYLATNDNCDQCSQSISLNHKTKKIEHLDQEIQKLDQGINHLKVSMKDVKQTIRDAELIISERDRLLNLQNTLNFNINHNHNFIESLEIDKRKASDIKDDHSATDLIQIENDLNDLKTNHKEQLHIGYVFNAAIKILKDDGVKTKVIKHYLPMINHYCNKYLQKLGFSISFEFDENFTETIKARHRDKFSYGSFSEGEKTRINLALLFTWRAIANLKNNASCNLLILDEILDSSLDQDGIADFIDIISSDSGSNIIVISHREEAASASFDKNIKITRINNFSKMEMQ